MSHFEAIKQSAYLANMRLTELNLVLFTFGNASAVDRDARLFAIKPSGVAYDSLSVESMVVCDFDGIPIDGDLRPSSDTKTHAYLYEKWTHIGGIVHTHSTYATAWAQSRRDIPLYGTTHADYLPTDVPCAPPMSDDMIAGDYERETGKQIVAEFRSRGISSEDVEMILLSNHGPFTWAKDAESAVHNSAVLERLAQMALLTEQISPGIDRMKESLVQRHHQRKHGPDSYYGQ